MLVPTPTQRVVGRMSKMSIKIWMDFSDEKQKVRAIVPLPFGLRDEVCPHCGRKISGALITESSDPVDPNVMCEHCPRWRP